jgi:uncharacterized protein (DUF697 family)
MKLIETIISRWKAETPSFFNKLKKLAIALVGSATAVWTANSTMSLELSPFVLSICKYIIAMSVAMGVTAQLTQVDPSEQPKNN